MRLLVKKLSGGQDLSILYVLRSGGQRGTQDIALVPADTAIQNKINLAVMGHIQSTSGICMDNTS